MKWTVFNKSYKKWWSADGISAAKSQQGAKQYGTFEAAKDAIDAYGSTDHEYEIKSDGSLHYEPAKRKIKFT